MGYEATERPFGWYWDTGHVYVDGLTAERIPDLIADVKSHYDRRVVYLNLDGRQAVSTLGPVLEANGCTRGGTEIYLAHVGDPPDESPSPDRSTVETVGLDNIEACIATKLRAFSDSEEDPDPTALEGEVAARGKELNGLGRGELLLVDGVAAAMIWWYEPEVAEDPFYINLVAVDAAYRSKGIGTYLVTRRIRDFCARESGDMVLSAVTDNEGAIRLYRRLGFTDEVLWRQRYVYGADAIG